MLEGDAAIPQISFVDCTSTQVSLVGLQSHVLYKRQNKRTVLVLCIGFAYRPAHSGWMEMVNEGEGKEKKRGRENVRMRVEFRFFLVVYLIRNDRQGRLTLPSRQRSQSSDGQILRQMRCLLGVFLPVEVDVFLC